MSNRCGGPADCANVHVVYSEVIVVRARQTTMFDLTDDLVFSNESEKSVFFVADSRSEKASTLERKKSPQAVELEWSPIVTNRFDESAVSRIVIVDPAVAKASDPKL